MESFFQLSQGFQLSLYKIWLPLLYDVDINALFLGSSKSGKSNSNISF